MNNNCVKIIIKSGSGFFCGSPWEDKLVVTDSLITYDLKIYRDRFQRELQKKVYWKRFLNEPEKERILKVFDYARDFDFIDKGTVLDGEGLELFIKLADGTTRKFYATYGDCIDKSYDSLHELLQMISPLIEDGVYKPDYFNGEEPPYYEIDEEEEQ